MCRRFQMYAISLIAFGAGVLLGGSLDGGLVVIRHWKIHNWIRGDRLRPTVYTAQKAALVLDESGAYTLCQTSDSQVTDNCHT